MTTAQSLKIRKRFRSVLYQIIAIGIGLLLVSPILYALVISFMPGGRDSDHPAEIPAFALDYGQLPDGMDADDAAAVHA